MVLIQKCSTYDREVILERVKEIFEKNGGIEKFASPGKKVVIKPNLVSKKSPEAAATTHPSLVWAVATLCKEAGADVVIAESSGGPYEKPLMKALYRATGIEQAALDSGAILNYDLTETKVDNPGAKYLKSLNIITPVAEADTVISLSKLKTHGMMVYTGAVKNLFGVIAGLQKAEYHMKMSDYDEFADCIIDIFLSARVSLNIIDAVVGMDRDGPTAGDPKKMDLLISSTDAFEADMTALEIIGVKPERVPVFKNAIKRGLVKENTKDFDFAGGLKPSDVLVPDFKVKYNDQLNNLYFIKGPFGKWFSKIIRPRPVFHRNKCKACRECEKCCPAKVITVTKEKGAKVNLDGCIRCYCCQELCPFKAVTIKKPLLNKLFIRSKK
ncbi:MAG: DUF362 domain-containing protein [Ruminococcaceae bacterium]|nr:DUF362 domain-containing protein [Oscillospiraceae bacterium]